MAIRGKRNSTVAIHNLIFLNYLRIIKGYGDVARKISKGTLYEEAGEPFGFNAWSAGLIIRKALKMPNEEIKNILIKNEAEDMLDMVLQLKGV